MPAGVRFKIERRKIKNPWVEFLGMGMAILASIGVCSVLIAASGASVREALGALYVGAFGSTDAFLETLVQATPLMFTGLAVLVAFRAKVWNIGVEGQLWMGIIWATFANLYLGFLPPILLPLVTIAMAMAGGAFTIVALSCG